ncbi:MAG: hypothetical protein PVJ39_04605 [Gammaproteobacteria bacterium]|jgi:hypothetical protein
MKESVKAEYDKLAQKLNDQRALHEKLQEFFDKHGHIPDEYIGAWNKYQQNTKPWWEQSRVVKRLRKTAKLMAANTKRTKEKRAKMADKAAKKVVDKAKRRGQKV